MSQLVAITFRFPSKRLMSSPTFQAAAFTSCPVQFQPAFCSKLLLHLIETELYNTLRMTQGRSEIETTLLMKTPFESAEVWHHKPSQ